MMHQRLIGANDVDGALSQFARLWGAAYAIYETGKYPARAAVAAVGLPVEDGGDE